MATVTTEADILATAVQALRLLPEGLAWTKRIDSTTGKFWSALCTLLADVQSRGLDLLNEADTRTVEELIADWEEYLALPEPGCTASPGTALLRRFVVYAKHTRQGGQSRQFFIDLAAALGFAITVEEFLPYTVGGPAAMGSKLYTDPWRWTWRVHAPVHTVTFARAGKHRAGESIAYSDNTLLECNLEAVKPAHTNLVFEYDLPYVGVPDGPLGQRRYAPWSNIYPPTAVLELTQPAPVVSGQAPL